MGSQAPLRACQVPSVPGMLYAVRIVRYLNIQAASNRDDDQALGEKLVQTWAFGLKGRQASSQSVPEPFLRLRFNANNHFNSHQWIYDPRPFCHGRIIYNIIPLNSMKIALYNLLRS